VLDLTARPLLIVLRHTLLSRETLHLSGHLAGAADNRDVGEYSLDDN